MPDDDVAAARQLLGELGRALLAGGHLDDAQSAMDEAIALAGDDVDVALFDRPRGDRPVAGAAVGGDRAAGEGRDRDAEGRPEIRAEIELRLLYLKRWSGDIEGAIASGQAALEAAQQAADA